MRVGVFGGTFDPVHLGHTAAARAALDGLHLDQVLIVPTSRQPFKRSGPIASSTHRLRMLELAASGDPDLVVDSREVDRGGVSYTVDTLEEIRGEHPDYQLFLLIGADTARSLEEWHRVDEVVQLSNVVVLTRPGYSLPDISLPHRELAIPLLDVSATNIRASLQENAQRCEGLHPDVERYIREHGLYDSKES